jgi:hypothetical protein
MDKENRTRWGWDKNYNRKVTFKEGPNAPHWRSGILNSRQLYAVSFVSCQGDWQASILTLQAEWCALCPSPPSVLMVPENTAMAPTQQKLKGFSTIMWL